MEIQSYDNRHQTKIPDDVKTGTILNKVPKALKEHTEAEYEVRRNSR